MPKQYDFLARLFVLAYCVTLPVGIVESLGWFTPLGSTIVGIMFMALDKIGRDLEDPFDNSIYDVPMTAIATTIEINLRQLASGNCPKRRSRWMGCYVDGTGGLAIGVQITS